MSFFIVLNHNIWVFRSSKPFLKVRVSVILYKKTCLANVSAGNETFCCFYKCLAIVSFFLKMSRFREIFWKCLAFTNETIRLFSKCLAIVSFYRDNPETFWKIETLSSHLRSQSDYNSFKDAFFTIQQQIQNWNSKREVRK